MSISQSAPPLSALQVNPEEASAPRSEPDQTTESPPAAPPRATSAPPLGVQSPLRSPQIPLAKQVSTRKARSCMEALIPRGKCRPKRQSKPVGLVSGPNPRLADGEKGGPGTGARLGGVPWFRGPSRKAGAPRVNCKSRHTCLENSRPLHAACTSNSKKGDQAPYNVEAKKGKGTRRTYLPRGYELSPPNS